MGRFEGLRNRVAELIEGSRDEEPEPEGFQGEERSSGIIRGGVLEHDPPRDDLNYYRRLYENVGPIKAAIDNFSSEVIEPGWYITCDDEETADQLTEYFKNVGIVNTETNVNGSDLMLSMVREREIKGTVFLETVTDSEGRNQALYPLQNDTITIYTKPGKAMLPAPDDDAAEPFDAGMERDQPPINDKGEMGAYVQFDEISPRWSGTREVVYTRDDVIKWTRDAPMGEPRGTSRIAASAQRAEGLLEKLQDNDDAVKFKAWPQIIFQMGDEQNPWNAEEVQNFIEKYDEEQMSPGLMQAVAGDVTVEEFAGETADISDTLNFDISMIMSGLPGPVYATGGFAQNVAPSVAEAQQRQFIKEVKKSRRELENLLTPYLRDVAEDYNLDGADSVELHVGRPPGQVPPEDIEGNIIRYTTDVEQGGQSAKDQEEGLPGDNSSDDNSGGATAPQPGDATGSPSTSTEKPSAGAPTAGDASTETPERTSENEAGGQDESFPGVDYSDTERLEIEELADPRLVSTATIENELSDLLRDELIDARDAIVAEFEGTQDAPLREAGGVVSAVERTVDERVTASRIDGRSRPMLSDAVEATLDTLGQENHTPTIDVDTSARHRQRTRFLSNNVADSFENTVDDMLEFATVNTRQAVQHEESPRVVAERVRESYDDDTLERQADVIARVEIMSGVNALKMAEYDRHPDVDGVKLVNPCNDNTTRLCEQIACDEHAEALFDADESLAEQFSSEVSDDLLFDGFDPLPNLPPFHFNCRTEIVPIPTDEV